MSTPIVQRHSGFGQGGDTAPGAGGCVHHWSEARGIRTRVRESRCEPGLFDHKISDGSIVREARKIETRAELTEIQSGVFRLAIYLPAGADIPAKRFVMLTSAGIILAGTAAPGSLAYLIGSALTAGQAGKLVPVLLFALPFQIEAAGGIALAEVIAPDLDGRAIPVAPPSDPEKHRFIALNTAAAGDLVQAIYL